MASGHEEDVISSAKNLFELIEALPPSAEAAALRKAAEKHDQALRATGHELGRPTWMRP